MTDDYPIREVIPDIKRLLAANNRLILQAPPGAGKSTILPWNLLNESWLEGKKIIMLEPRRLATKSVAVRMAELLSEKAGQTIGYRIRFEQMIGPATRCEVVTEGILTRMIQEDNALEDVGLVVFDEFHERSLHADLALALCCEVQQIIRPDLRILVMSATLDTANVSAMLKGAPTITSTGRQYPVTVKYVAQEKDLSLIAGVTRTIRRALTEQSGDILVFLPGAGEIMRVKEALEQDNVQAKVCGLFGALPFDQQQEAIFPDRHGNRKIVLATSIAETSLTIQGITTVVDSGYSRVPRFDPRSGLTRLDTVRVTKDAADQRAGRSGRLGPGVCYRMWNEHMQHMLLPSRQPEILEADLAPLVLELHNWGILNAEAIGWVTPPPAGTVNQAKTLLQQLGAIDDNGITPHGRLMLRLPSHPRISHMLLSIERLRALAVDVASLLEERDPLEKSAGSDLTLRVDALRKWRRGERVNVDTRLLDRIERAAAAWRRILECKVDNGNPVDYDVGSLIAMAYPERIARQFEKFSPRYKLANGRVAKVPDHDPLVREPWLAIADVDSGQSEGRIFLAAALHESDFVHLASPSNAVVWDFEKGALSATTEYRLGNIVVKSEPMTNIDARQRVAAVCAAIRSEGLRMLSFNETNEQWRARIMSLRVWRSDEAWPDVSDENLLNTLEEWLGPYLENVSRKQDLSRLEMGTILEGILPWELTSKLNSHAPARLNVPSGSAIKIHYHHDGSAPFIEVRLQEMFGLQDTPTVNEGRNAVVVHLLSPGYKPVQVTQDLKSFWHSAYHEVRKEMRRRYPKHHWPEDPWTAEAVRGVKKRT
ncbi:ATP-dependent helicase HrpB [Chryseolinea sp. T2]|uniref:ATP-dependent helicase HrpB n=1 Tax=Chryseolinea sp. T2 TaxID=3129255 RepID=UPI00307715F9